MAHQRSPVLGQNAGVFKPLPVLISDYGPLWVGHVLGQGGSPAETKNEHLETVC